jgi:hypothetical protein
LPEDAAANCTIAWNDSPNMPMRPLDQGCAAIQFRIWSASFAANSCDRLATPVEAPVPERSTTLTT